MLKGLCAALLAGVFLAGCSYRQTGEDATHSADVANPAPGASQSATLADLGRPPTADLSKITAHPLGSRNNPIRVNGVAGQNAYLQRLRCANGPPPEIRRLGRSGVGPYGKPIDGFDLECDESVYALYVDANHPDHVEGRPPRGFVWPR